MPRIASLHVHPVKSCAGSSPDAALLTPTGLQHDREWLIVDAEGRFVTQRDDPRLALLRPTVDGALLRLSAPGVDPLELAVDHEGAPATVTCWRSRCAAFDAGDAAARWLATALRAPEAGLRLVRFDPRHERLSNRDYTGEVIAPNLFSDGYPLMVLSQASLDDLNGRLPRPLPMDRFRPNLVLDGVPPYAEDTLVEIEAGPVLLRLVKPCTRCVITTTDQASGERDGDEPLRTLKSYRFHRGLRGVTFGMNAVIVRGQGERLERHQPVIVR